MLRIAARSLFSRKGGVSLSAGQSQLRRSFAADAVSDDIRPPIQVFGVAGKYASALYVSAAKANVLEQVEKEMQQLLELEKDSLDFSNFIKDPSVPKPTRVAAIEDIFGKADFSAITKNFLAVLADGGRLAYLPKAATSYKELIRAHKGEVLATVTAALELSPEEVSEIKEALKSFLKPGQTLNFEQKVDRSIVGGLIIDIGENHIDLSIDTKIRQMEKVLTEAA